MNDHDIRDAGVLQLDARIGTRTRKSLEAPLGFLEHIPASVTVLAGKKGQGATWMVALA